jgi:hypothetical protein
VVDPPWPEPGLRDTEALALRSEQVRDGDSYVVEPDLRVPTGLVEATEHRDLAHDGEARRGGWDEQHRMALTARGIGVGHAHHDGDAAAR